MKLYVRPLLSAFCALCLLGASIGQAAAAAVPEATNLLLYPGSSSVYVDGFKTEAALPPIERESRVYLPAAELEPWLGLPVNWEEEKGAVQITTPKAFLELTPADQTLYVNGAAQPWGEEAMLESDRLYIALAFLERYVSFRSRIDEESRRVDLSYIRSSTDPSLFANDTMPNMKPIAKFAVDREYYRIGEPIRYMDLSYDPKGGKLEDVKWTGNAQAIFVPGLYKVSLEVTDSLGQVSETFSRNILVKDQPYLDEFEYHVHHKPVGTYVREEEEVLRAYLRGIPQLNRKERKPEDRPLLVSDSPETFTEKGMLYRDKVNGKGRLYADHVNGTDRKMKFAIIAHNPDNTRSVTIKTTNQGEVYPSIYANLIGNEATIEFLQGGQREETMSLQPGESAYYRTMPDFYPGQGVNVMYDVETNGEVVFTFVAMEQKDGLEEAALYPALPYSGNVRGTFTGSEVLWEMVASSVKVPTSFAIGDGTSDVFVSGRDAFEKKSSINLGNYGVVYQIQIKAPPRMSVLILPRGGVFKGPFKVDGKIVQTPPSGVMMDYQGYTIIARTNGTEPSLNLEFSPAAGSAFPIDVILYPLE
ncbi:stalk domain-containing protein [Paenibacillus puerhi]|uniref:stalk domain-containing protein n=1 Tax=Paenibacillus puerhi TaxID=2692622 RepID=UPI0013590DAF|nr:stalk domain-containing protein [Paenibacillus puerhi]